MKKYIKRIWFTVAAPIEELIFFLIVLLLLVWPSIWKGEQDREPWDFWNK